MHTSKLSSKKFCPKTTDMEGSPSKTASLNLQCVALATSFIPGSKVDLITSALREANIGSLLSIQILTSYVSSFNNVPTNSTKVLSDPFEQSSVTVSATWTLTEGLISTATNFNTAIKEDFDGASLI